MYLSYLLRFVVPFSPIFVQENLSMVCFMSIKLVPIDPNNCAYIGANILRELVRKRCSVWVRFWRVRPFKFKHKIFSCTLPYVSNSTWEIFCLSIHTVVLVSCIEGLTDRLKWHSEELRNYLSSDSPRQSWRKDGRRTDVCQTMSHRLLEFGQIVDMGSSIQCTRSRRRCEWHSSLFGLNVVMTNRTSNDRLHLLFCLWFRDDRCISREERWSTLTKESDGQWTHHSSDTSVLRASDESLP